MARKTKADLAQEEAARFEYCPECGDGWPTYMGLSKDSKHHTFSCSNQECEAYYRVEVGKGQYDMRLGMELSPDVIYYEKCEICRKPKPVKLRDFRFICRPCHVES